MGSAGVDRGNAFDAVAIVGIEAGQHRAVEIDHARDGVATQQGNDELGARGCIASDVAGKGMDVVLKVVNVGGAEDMDKAFRAGKG